MELLLGTAQFGLPYGIAGPGAVVSSPDATRILSAAWDGGIRVLDTAAAYGDVEARLDELCGSLAFRVISKIPRLPAHLSPSESARWAVTQADESLRRLNGRLCAVLAHNALDVTGPEGSALALAMSDWCARNGIAFGVSAYAPDELPADDAGRWIRILQLPANALDQRTMRAFPARVAGLDLHLRSIFLQGLLLMPREEAEHRLPSAAGQLRAWHAWCSQNGLPPLQACLGIAKGVAGASGAVVGAQTLEQMQSTLRAWSEARSITAPDLATADRQVIDPRQWQVKTPRPGSPGPKKEIFP